MCKHVYNPFLFVRLSKALLKYIVNIIYNIDIAIVWIEIVVKIASEIVTNFIKEYRRK